MPPEKTVDAPGPLAGVRVIDLTSVVMGPFATRIFGDLGADVIKVESDVGDVMRQYEPNRNAKMSGITLNIDRNKRSIVIDLKSPDGRRALLDLVASADVFVSNMRRPALDRLGLDVESLRSVRADLVICIANGYAAEGPKADEPAYDDIIQATSGLAGLFAWTLGEPQLVPSIVADKVCGLHIAYAVVAALFQRERTGHGATIDVPMTEVMAAFNLVEHLNGQTFEPPEGPISYGRVRTPNRRPRRTSDGWIVILPYTDDQWRSFWTRVERPDLIDDPRYSTPAARVNNADVLYGLLDELIERDSTEAWLSFCREAHIPAGEVFDLADVRTDGYFDEVGLFEPAIHPTEGEYVVVAQPARFDGAGPTLRRHAPRLGEHTDEILAELRAEVDRD